MRGAYLVHFSWWHCFNEQAFGDWMGGVVSHGSEMAMGCQLIIQISFLSFFFPS